MGSEYTYTWVTLTNMPFLRTYIDDRMKRPTRLVVHDGFGYSASDINFGIMGNITYANGGRIAAGGVLTDEYHWHEIIDWIREQGFPFWSTSRTFARSCLVLRDLRLANCHHERLFGFVNLRDFIAFRLRF